MRYGLTRGILRLTSRPKAISAPSPLLLELFGRPPADPESTYQSFPFAYHISKRGQVLLYSVSVLLTDESVSHLRGIVREVSEGLRPEAVRPLTFARLVEVLTQDAAGHLGKIAEPRRLNDTAELVAYEAIGLSRVLALAKDRMVAEFYVDSDSSPLYLDHARVGRCETDILLAERERKAVETHLDTFRGYTPDFVTPSLKNDLEVAGARLRVSLDLEPVSVNRFALDVRRLDVSAFSLRDLITMGVLSPEAAAFLVTWLQTGGNLTIIGETGSGKTTLMNALDERLNPKLRRIYIEDAVETKDLLPRGYHQLKIKVEPFERGRESTDAKGKEVVKALHRSPDIVILSEIQSEEHSRAFFHALSAGIRGMQTFHASSLEQAIRRWTNIHGIPKEGLLDLGVLLQMARPDRLRPARFVTRISEMSSADGNPRLRDIYLRDRDFNLRRVAEWDKVATQGQPPLESFVGQLMDVKASLEGMTS